MVSSAEMLKILFNAATLTLAVITMQDANRVFKNVINNRPISLNYIFNILCHLDIN